MEEKQILEIHKSNRSFSKIQEYIDLTKSKYNVEIRLDQNNMENYKKTTFRIICDSEAHLEQTLKWYNEMYDTDFVVVNKIYDEVNFIDLESTKFTLTDIFNIGYQLGTKIQKLRDLGEIDL